MVWIRQPALPLGRSGHENLSLLWKHDRLPIYLMDNHRAAWWCWMQHLHPEDTYRFVHIDYHWDVGLLDDEDFETLRQLREELQRDLQQYDEVVSDLHSRRIIQADNYIEPFIRLFPKAAAIFMHAHQDRCEGGVARLAEHHDARVFSRPPDFFQALLEAWAGQDGEFGDQIINVDLDYAFMDLDGAGAKRVVSDRYLRWFFQAVRAQIDQKRVRVVTIALSQDWCGGEANAVRAWLAVARALRVRSPLGVTRRGLVEFARGSTNSRRVEGHRRRGAPFE